jgi:hypothetical protein
VPRVKPGVRTVGPLLGHSALVVPSSLSHARPRGLPALLALSLGLALLKLLLVASGPDLDTDAYGHAVIGRHLLSDWSNVRVHWVWLPLWHVVHATAAALGVGMTGVRVANVALSVAAPVLLARTLLPRAGPGSPIPVLAGALLALSPECVTISESAQPETLFLVLVLGALSLWEQERPIAAGALAAAATLTRYEGWLLPMVLALAWARGPRTQRLAAAWLIPGAAIAAWVVVHRVGTGTWFEFLRLNRDYVRDAIAASGYPWGRAWNAGAALAWFPLVRPAYDCGVFVLLAPFGLRWLVQRAPFVHCAFAAALLAFLTYGELRGQHLGLARHYVALSPAYSTAIAAGALTVASFVGARWKQLAPFVMASPRALGALVLAFALTRTMPRVVWLVRQHMHAFLPERDAAEALRRALPSGGLVACDLPRIEVFSRLPPERFFNGGSRASSSHDARYVVAPAERAPALAKDATLVYANDVVVIALLRGADDPRLTRNAPNPARLTEAHVWSGPLLAPSSEALPEPSSEALPELSSRPSSEPLREPSSRPSWTRMEPPHGSFRASWPLGFCRLRGVSILGSFLCARRL